MYIQTLIMDRAADVILCWGISGCSDELPSEAQVNDYMDLCLHLLQKCHYMIDKEG